MPTINKTAPPLDKKHYININPRGTFENYTALGAWNKYKTSYTDIDNMFSEFRVNKERHIALFFHGGLVNESRGMDTASRFKEFYYNKPDHHTVGFVWETGFMTSLVQHFNNAVSEPDFQSVMKRVAGILIRKLGLELGGIPFDANKMNKIYANEQVLYDADNRDLVLDKASVYEEFTLSEIEEEFVQDLPEEQQMDFYSQKMNVSAYGSNKAALGASWLIIAGIKAAARCIYRFARKRNHSILATVQEEIYRQLKYMGVGVESLAIAIWSEMKKQAEVMWQPNTNRKGDEQFAGRYFLDSLNAYVKEVAAEGGSVKVELVAHSAGAVVVCKLFDLLKKEPVAYADIQFNNVIFMAPACKCDLFSETVMNMTNRFHRYRQFSMSREIEQKDILVDVNGLTWLYPSSLLYFVSGLCEDGDSWFDEDVKGDTCILGLAQHISGRKPYNKSELLQKVHKFLSDGGEYHNRIALVPSGDGAPVGYCGYVEDHGKFDNDAEDDTANSIKKSIRHLFQN